MTLRTNISNSANTINAKPHVTIMLLSALLVALPMSLFAAADGEGAWCEHATANSSSPTARHEAGGLTIGSNFYVLGGRATRPLERLNTVTNTWDMSVAAPMEMHHFQPVEWGGKIYVVGAFTCCYPNEVNVAKVQIFDPATQIWSEGDDMPVARQRGSAGTVVHNNKIYLLGGNTNGHDGGAVPWFDEYNPATGQWTALTDAPNSRDHFAAVMVGSKLVAAGGRQTEQPNSQQNTEVEVDVYDFQSGQWMTGFQNIPTPRAGVATVSYDSEVIVIGGETNQTQAHNEVEALNINTGLWRTLPALINGRHGHAAGIVGDDLYVAAGNTVAGGGSETTSVEQISLPSVAGPAGDQDPDNDGLTTAEEINTYGTNPNKKDTDDDSLSDGAELLTHDTDPLLADTDDDTLNDGLEIDLGTNPKLSDTDADGDDDALEVSNGTDPLDPADFTPDSQPEPEPEPEPETEKGKSGSAGGAVWLSLAILSLLVAIRRKASTH